MRLSKLVKKIHYHTFVKKDILRKITLYIFGRIMYQQRVEERGNQVPPKFFLRNLNQMVIEAGKTPPWIMSMEECPTYWRSMSNDQDSSARPEDYAKKTLEIVEAICDLWTPEITNKNSVLELGCNCGPIFTGCLI